jgi:hypothetical protein
LQDFYLDLTEDGRGITPRDYLESALQPILGTGKAFASKNEVRPLHSFSRASTPFSVMYFVVYGSILQAILMFSEIACFLKPADSGFNSGFVS